MTVWLRTGLGISEQSFSGDELPLLALPVGCAAVVAAVAALVGALTGSSALRTAATLAGVVVIAVAALVIVVAETVAALVPKGLLPSVAGTEAVELSAGPGAWIALAGGVVMLAATRGWQPPFLSAPREAARGRRVHRWLPAVALVLATVAFGWLRYEPWLSAAAGGSAENLTGWSLPWIGPLSLLALVLLLAALVAASVLRLQIAGLLAAAGGWLVTLVTGIVGQSTSAIARLRIDDLAPASARDYSPHVDLAAATWVGFGTGLLAAAAGAGLLMLDIAPREGASWALS